MQWNPSCLLLGIAVFNAECWCAGAHENAGCSDTALWPKIDTIVLRGLLAGQTEHFQSDSEDLLYTVPDEQVSVHYVWPKPNTRQQAFSMCWCCTSRLQLCACFMLWLVYQHVSGFCKFQQYLKCTVCLLQVLVKQEQGQVVISGLQHVVNCRQSSTWLWTSADLQVLGTV